MFQRLRLLLLVALLAPSLPASEQPWAELKIGQSVEKTIAQLGEPILRSKGRGLERWTYDDGAEVLIHGTLVAWTAPASLRLPARSDDIWKQYPGLGYNAALRRVVPIQPPKRPAPAAKARSDAPTGVGFEEYLRG